MNSKWIQHEHLGNANKKKVFLFPYAGGGALFYSKWYRNLDETIDVYPIQLPGRENRMGDPLIDNLEETIKIIIDEIAGLLDCPFVFAGHSMGGLMSYEAASYLETHNMGQPEGILISGTVPPDKLKLTEQIHLLGDQEFCNKIIGYDNIESQMLQYKEFYKYFLPILKNDFKMVETYSGSIRKKIKCKMKITGGIDDPFVPIDLLKSWKEYSENPLSVSLYEGNHFYLKDHVPDMCKAIIELFQ